MADTFGVTIDHVRPHIPNLTIEASPVEGSNDIVTEDLVNRHIQTVGGWVRQRAGELEQGSSAYEMAAGLVAIGAAALTESAVNPERVGETDTTLAGFLWKIYRDGLDELLESLGIGTGGEGPTVPAGELDEPDYYFPEPMFTRNRGF